MLSISIIIPVRNRKELTGNILTQLYGQISRSNSHKLSIIVIDDGSTDGTKELIQTDFPTVHLIEGDGSLWWAGAIVKGMEYAVNHLEIDYVVWLNDDLSISEDFIDNLNQLCSSSKYQESIVGGIVKAQAYPNWIVYSGMKNGQPITDLDDFSSAEELEVDFLCGNIVIIPRTIIEKIGFPNATLLPHHGSDYEFIMRAKTNGFQAIVSSKLQATTDYSVRDFLRYMPYWMQWYLQPNPSQRWEIIKGLKTLKANQNIWMLVNMHSSNRNAKYIPSWRYTLCYLNKILRLLLIDFTPKQKAESRIYDYLNKYNPPQDIIKELTNQKGLSTVQFQKYSYK